MSYTSLWQKRAVGQYKPRGSNHYYITKYEMSGLPVGETANVFADFGAIALCKSPGVYNVQIKEIEFDNRPAFGLACGDCLTRLATMNQDSVERRIVIRTKAGNQIIIAGPVVVS